MNDLKTFLASDPRYVWRSFRAIRRTLELSNDGILEALAGDPSGFEIKLSVTGDILVRAN